MKRLAALLCFPVLLLCVFTVALVTTPNFVHAAAGRVREFAIPTPSGGPLWHHEWSRWQPVVHRDQ